MERSKVIPLSIASWHELTLEGIVPPMRIPINGVSMYPLIRRNRDMVSIVPITEPLTVGDIVLFADPRVPNRYVLHRLWAVNGNKVQTWGDNCDGPDGWLPDTCIWGKAVLIERGKRHIHPSPGKGMKLARLWHPVGKRMRHSKARVYRLLRPVWRLVKPLIRRKQP